MSSRQPTIFSSILSHGYQKIFSQTSSKSAWFVVGAVCCLAMMPLAIMHNGLDSATPTGAFLNNNLPQVTPGGAYNWTPVETFTGLKFDKPITFLPEKISGSDKIFVTEREGKIYSFSAGVNAAASKTLVLDITERVAGQVWDGGLLGMTFHPRYGTDSNYVYLYYCARAPYASYPTTSQGTGYPGTFFNVWGRLSRFDVNPGTGQIDSASEVIMINKRLYNGSHRGGALTFGGDGYLYVAVGEEFRYETAQDMESQLEGGILRIDVDRNPLTSSPPVRTLPQTFSDELSGVGYYIPNDNPFLDPTGTSFEEYYALGLRNPYKMAFDSTTSALWVGDVGGNAREEVCIIESGGNYGFPFREGTIVGSRTPPAVIQGTLTDPVAEFEHNGPEDMGAIVGGFVYRGTDFPGLVGKYICAGFASGEIWAVTYNDLTGTSTKVRIASAGFSGISSLGQDQQGEIYFMRHNANSKIYKIVASTSPDPPQFLSQVGAFSDLTTLSPVAGLIPYEQIEPFWSDAAEKYRWVMIPNDGTPDTLTEQISYSPSTDWEFPVGTVFMKHFELGMDDTDPTQKRRLETRFLVHGADGNYYGLTYKWNNAQTDAELLDSFDEDTLSIVTATGFREEVWLFPGRANCLSCHNEASKGALGPSSKQWNREAYYPSTGRTSQQITTFEHISFFAPDADTTALASLLTAAAKSDPLASLEDQALSYLDANCASCHMPGTDNRAVFDARLEVPLTGSQLIYGEVLDDLGIEGARIIVPGDTMRSVVYQRMKAVHSDIAMPPLAKNRVDTAGVRLIRDWILSLPSDSFVVGTGLEGKYYNNDDFTNLVKTQVDPEIDFFWGVNGPEGFSNPNHLSVRWTGEVLPLFSESYTFHTYSDDGVRLWVNGTLLIDDWFKNGTVSNSGNISLVKGQKVDITLEYLQGSASALVELSWESESQELEIIPEHLLFPTGGPELSQSISLSPVSNKQTTDGPFSVSATSSSGLPVTLNIVEGDGVVATLSGGNLITLTGVPGTVVIEASQAGGLSGGKLIQEASTVQELFFVFPPSGGQGTGLSATYFHDRTLTSQAFVRVDPEINFFWGSGSPDPVLASNNFSVRWQGEIELPAAGLYNFVTSTDDGVRLWVNSTQVIDQWNDQDNTSVSASISLPQGKVPIVMEYYDHRAYANATLSWSSDAIPLQIVPASALYPSGSGPFPVDFLSFTAKETEEGMVDLFWEVESTQEIGSFQIERSKDGSEFESIGRRSGYLGGSGSYTYTDTDPLPGYSYYRIREDGLNGTVTYSSVEEIQLEGWTLSIFPNPVREQRRLFVEGKAIISYQILSSSGKLVEEKHWSDNDGKDLFEIGLESYPSGVFYLVLEDPEGQQEVRKFLILPQ